MRDDQQTLRPHDPRLASECVSPEFFAVKQTRYRKTDKGTGVHRQEGQVGRLGQHVRQNVTNRRNDNGHDNHGGGGSRLQRRSGRRSRYRDNARRHAKYGENMMARKYHTIVSKESCVLPWIAPIARRKQTSATPRPTPVYRSY